MQLLLHSSIISVRLLIAEPRFVGALGKMEGRCAEYSPYTVSQWIREWHGPVSTPGDPGLAWHDPVAWRRQYQLNTQRLATLQNRQTNHRFGHLVKPNSARHGT